MNTDRQSEIHFRDLVTLLTVRRAGSITAAARELRIAPSQVSRAVARLEGIWNIRLLAPHGRGAHLSPEGMRAIPQVETAVAGLLEAAGAGELAPVLTVAAASSLVDTFFPPIAQCLPGLRLRGLVLPPAVLRACATRGLFDVALLTTDIRWLPSTWVSVCVGRLRKGLLASPTLAGRLGTQPLREEMLRELPFVVPVHDADGRFVAVEDDCPLPLDERVAGHEAQSIALALELASQTDQLVFGPVVAARSYMECGRLVEVRVSGWDVRDPLCVACNGDRVLSRVQREIVESARATLESIDRVA